MHTGNYAVCFELTGTCDISLDLSGVNHIDNTRLGYRYAVGIVGVIKQSYAYACVLYDIRIQGIAHCLIAVGAKMLDSKAVKNVKGADESTAAAVKAVIVGGQEYVKAGTVYS